jgi:TRAP-type transport system small permease protein
MKLFIEKCISRVASVALAASVVLVSFQIFLRFVFNTPLTWTEEVDRYLFVWVVYLGSAVAVAKKAHIRVTILIDLGGPKLAKICQFVDKICCILAFSFVVYFGSKLAYANLYARFYTLEFMPLILFYLSVPFGMLLSLMFLLWPAKKEK